MIFYDIYKRVVGCCEESNREWVRVFLEFGYAADFTVFLDVMHRVVRSVVICYAGECLDLLRSQAFLVDVANVT